MHIPFIISSPNLLLFALSRIVSTPCAYTAIPEASACRIFTTILSQGNCGACAAFAVSALVAMHACLADKEDFIPSPYRLFDCANGTCDGGISCKSALAVARFGVGDLRDSEPRFGIPCDLRSEHRRRHLPSITDVVIADPAQIKLAVMVFGPLLGSMTHLIRRDTGVYRLRANVTMPPPTLHAVVIVGWDTEDNWIVQNSWGKEWGDEFGRGRIGQDVLAYAFDPSVQWTKIACLVGVITCAVFSFYITPKRERRMWMIIYALLFAFIVYPPIIRVL
jgi:hypothetical protein